MKALITGQPGFELTNEFGEARELLKKSGFEPLFATIDMAPGESIPKALSQLLEPFNAVDSICFLHGWELRPIDRLLNVLAVESGKHRIYQSDNSVMVKMVIESVERGTEINLADMSRPGRLRKYFFARLILVHYLVGRCGMCNTEVKRIIGRGTITYCKKQFNYELKYNPEFRALFERTEKYLNNTVSV